MGDLSFLVHVNRRTDECLHNITELGQTIDMCLHMSHRDSFELRSTADRLRQIIERLETKATEIDTARTARHG